MLGGKNDEKKNDRGSDGGSDMPCVSHGIHGRGGRTGHYSCFNRGAEYTVTIPQTVTMGNEGTTVDVVASDVKNLSDGQKISVTIAGTSAYNDQMVLEADTSPSTSIRYQIINEAGETIETNASTGAVGVGKEVVSFTEDGTKQYQIKPVIAGRYEYGVEYTGSITFGIEVQ